MKLGVGLKVTEGNLHKIKQLPIDFVTLYCGTSSIRTSQVKVTYPHLELKGETLISPRKQNNRFLWDRYQFIAGYTRLEIEKYILRYTLRKIERNKPYIKQWEVFNEIIKDDGKPRNCHLWGNEFYSKVIKEIRLAHPDVALVYSDYNILHEPKLQAIHTIIDEHKLDGLAIQMHLSLFSGQWLFLIGNHYLDAIVKRFKAQSKRVIISEAGIRLNTPHTLPTSIRPHARLRDALHGVLLGQVDEQAKQEAQKKLWRWLIQRCQEAGVDEFYCFQTDEAFVNDSPSFIDTDYCLKI